MTSRAAIGKPNLIAASNYRHYIVGTHEEYNVTSFYHLINMGEILRRLQRYIGVVLNAKISIWIQKKTKLLKNYYNGDLIGVSTRERLLNVLSQYIR